MPIAEPGMTFSTCGQVAKCNRLLQSYIPYIFGLTMAEEMPCARYENRCGTAALDTHTQTTQHKIEESSVRSIETVD